MEYLSQKQNDPLPSLGTERFNLAVTSFCFSFTELHRRHSWDIISARAPNSNRKVAISISMLGITRCCVRGKDS